MAAIEAEFGEPVRETILGLRTQPNSWRTVAGALGISLSTLKGWRRALGLPIVQNDKLFDPSSLPDGTPSDRKARGLGYRDLRHAISEMRCGDGLTVRQVAGRVGICVSTVVDNTPEGARVTQGRTPRKLASCMANLRRAWQHKPAPDHPWRLDEDARRGRRDGRV